MVDFSSYVNNVRDTYLEKTNIYVQLPQFETQDCTCVTDTNRMSILNGPASYCGVCNNTGFIDIKREFLVEGILVDYASDAGSLGGYLETSGSGDFDAQRYVIHASYEDCFIIVAEKNCFDLAKEVRIGSVFYGISSYDESTMLRQVRATIYKKN
jgi:hypothetical protein